MRGTQDRQQSMLGLTSIEARIPSDHPLRRIKKMADQELVRLSRVFDRMYSNLGRPSVAPEKILKSLLLIALYSVRSERQFCEQLGYNLLFRWFFLQSASIYLRIRRFRALWGLRVHPETIPQSTPRIPHKPKRFRFHLSGLMAQPPAWLSMTVPTSTRRKNKKAFRNRKRRLQTCPARKTHLHTTGSRSQGARRNRLPGHPDR
jgi:hypothetical protein